MQPGFSKAPQPTSYPLPAWAETLRQRYVSGQYSLFLLHGNTQDMVRAPHGYLTLRAFLAHMLGRKEIIAFYNRSEGLQFSKPREMEPRFIQTVNAIRTMDGRAEIPAINRSPTSVLPILEDFLARPLISEGSPGGDAWGAVIVDYVETICPNNDIAQMNAEDRSTLVTLQRWASSPQVLSSDNIIILVTTHLSEIHRRVVSSPQICPIQVSLPNEEERSTFIDQLRQSYDVSGLETSQLAPITAGLGYLQIEGIFRRAQQDREQIDYDRIAEAKRGIIEHECHGLIEFIRPRHDFSHVGGMDHIKRALKGVVHNMLRGAHDRVPMGILFVGPMGTGKSFVAGAFANESGMTCIKLKNFRDKWVGSTEANLEKILGVIDAMGHVVVMIDEGDRSIGGGSGEDGGTSSRVIARLKEFMADTSHRGSIVFIMMTNRPDKLDADMKRAGRFDMKLPFFSPQNTEERLAITRALLRKNAIPHQGADWDWDTIDQRLTGMSGAEIESILLNSITFAEDENRSEVSDKDVLASADDYIPSQDTTILELMELLAVFECSSRRLLPEQFKEVNTAELNDRIRVLKARLL